MLSPITLRGIHGLILDMSTLVIQRNESMFYVSKKKYLLGIIYEQQTFIDLF